MNRQQRRHVADIPALIAEALQHQRAGRAAPAERLYRQALAAEPRHADSLHLLGVLAHQTGRPGLAADTIRQAIAANPQNAAYHTSLGNVLGEQGEHDAAVASFRAAIRLRPDHPNAHYNLGKVLHERGESEAALASFRRTVALKPDHAAAHVNLGVILRERGELDEAVASLQRAVELAPDNSKAHYNLGTALLDQKQPEAAIASLRRALALRPDYPNAHLNLGNALSDQGESEAAAACFARALDLQPDDPLAHNSLGSVLRGQGRLDEAAACFLRAIALKDDFAEAHNNLGITRMEQARLTEAMACYERAIALKPDDAQMHGNLGMALLATGEYARGWQEFEWRWLSPQLIDGQRHFAQPQWRGEPGGGRTLLIHAEQGFGDTLQFCRYAALAQARGWRVIMEVQRALLRLLQSLPGVDGLLAGGEALPDFDMHCPMLSLPAALGTTLETIPAEIPYLTPDPAQVAHWRGRLAVASDRTPRVGLVWAGNPRLHHARAAEVDRRRSLAPERLRPLFDIASVQFYSLQKGGPAAPADAPVIDFMAEMGDFADTAALIAQLDLIISVDTSVAHLAGAIGRPVWLLDRFDACWRWLINRQDSPWYPLLRLYRQPRPGDWDSVVADVARDLSALAAERCTRLHQF